MATSTKAAAPRTSVPSASAEAIRQWVTLDGKARAKKKAAIDQMHKDGIRSTDCLSPRSKTNGHTCTKELYADLVLTVQMGMSKEAQTLLNKEPKTLSEADNDKRNDFVKQRGSLLKDLKNALQRREGKGPQGNTRTSMQIVGDNITQTIERVAGLDPEIDKIPDVCDIAETQRHLKAALAAFLGK